MSIRPVAKILRTGQNQKLKNYVEPQCRLCTAVGTVTHRILSIPTTTALLIVLVTFNSTKYDSYFETGDNYCKKSFVAGETLWNTEVSMHSLINNGYV
jgi:hypothetical protein